MFIKCFYGNNIKFHDRQKLFNGKRPWALGHKASRYKSYLIHLLRNEMC